MQLEKSYEILCKAFNDEAKTILEVKHQPWALLDWFSEKVPLNFIKHNFLNQSGFKVSIVIHSALNVVKHLPRLAECLDQSCFNVFIIHPSHSTIETSSQKRTMLFLTLVCCLQDREDELDQLDKDGSSY